MLIKTFMNAAGELMNAAGVEALKIPFMLVGAIFFFHNVIDIWRNFHVQKPMIDNDVNLGSKGFVDFEFRNKMLKKCRHHTHRIHHEQIVQKVRIMLFNRFP
jgi:hypothetical protein